MSIWITWFHLFTASSSIISWTLSRELIEHLLLWNHLHDYNVCCLYVACPRFCFWHQIGSSLKFQMEIIRTVMFASALPRAQLRLVFSFFPVSVFSVWHGWGYLYACPIDTMSLRMIRLIYFVAALFCVIFILPTLLRKSSISGYFYSCVCSLCHCRWRSSFVTLATLPFVMKVFH